MAELYVMHHATCARKALFALLEKGAPLPTVEVDRMYLVTPEYRAMNPDGLVPTLRLDDGQVLVESTVIMRYIDEAYDGPSLQPADPVRRAQMNLWMKWIDEKYFPALGAPTAATFLRKLFGMPGDEQKLAAMLASLTDHNARMMREECIRMGLASPFSEAGLAKLREMLKRMDEVLSRQPWLAGDTLTLADCAMAPIMLRLNEVGLSPAWEQLPALSDWWQRLSARPTMRRLVDMADPSLLVELIDSFTEARDQLLKRLR
ncbi:glutathione S-transferase family protein [Sphingomonas sp. AOB5]|uniref:glutathione S-transferase family protein n=1 Tax=Sphingomonas sp. AOB5 TaxID=3034017 RepID=UPI0023F725BF|nr:glutathione S-transferase family protein [Sphingomonas sp. AOB5]MDF7775364.1 glutathione S-transferase family protein [Sphingomonas sp. AOB5]